MGVAAVLAAAVGPWVAWSISGGYFWPRWVWFGLAAVVSAVSLARWVWSKPGGDRRWLLADAALLVFLVPVEFAVWLMSGRGFFWPVYSLTALTVLFGAHVWFLARRDDPRQQELIKRVDTLTRTRRGAVDSQATELRRIERDLHDGAQARMVSAALSIGIAQGLLETDPTRAAALLSDARAAAVGAVEDLRGVMHGIYPAVLSDRGLGGAVRALVYDLSIPVTVDGDPPTALPAAVESAVYFAIAECLANAVKHGHAASGWVHFAASNRRLTVEVGDDGAGGATVVAGTGLRGIVERLAAFDATLEVASPPGGPTRIIIQVPLT